MTIVIEGADHGPSWDKLEMMVRSCKRGECGKFVRICRIDGAADYRARSTYRAVWRDAAGETEDVLVEVR